MLAICIYIHGLAWVRLVARDELIHQDAESVDLIIGQQG